MIRISNTFRYIAITIYLATLLTSFFESQTLLFGSFSTNNSTEESGICFNHSVIGTDSALSSIINSQFKHNVKFASGSIHGTSLIVLNTNVSRGSALLTVTQFYKDLPASVCIFNCQPPGITLQQPSDIFRPPQFI